MYYRTIKMPATAEFIEKKSRFIGHISPVSTKEDAETFINDISKKHRDATHNVFAYSLRGGAVRCSDNGEPQGTAGVPTLDVIQKSGLTDVCIVSTRYFGGIMLGGGGLVRAYSHTASIAVSAAEILTLTLCREISVCCDYSFYGKLSNILPDYPLKVVNTDFLDNVTVSLIIESGSAAALCAALTEASNGVLSADKGILLLDEKYFEL